MRPETEIHGRELYECFKCGARSETGSNTCECGGELQHLGRSRDL
ncbi:rubrerythrin-like domain-containing protein [Halorubrum sp. N11]